MKIIFYIPLLLASIFCKAQDFKKCTIYQFSGEDSTKKHIALVRIFNNQGQIVSETYSNYKTSIVESNIDGTYHYNYSDTLLTEQVFIDYNKDTSKTLYFYNKLNQRVREEYFICERSLRKGVKKGFGQPGGCVVYKEDLDSNCTWLKTNEVTFLYDEHGRLIRKDDKQDFDRVWVYDDTLNRISQEKGYSSGRLAFVDSYQYFMGGYFYSTVNYDNNGKPKLPEYSDYIFSPIYTSTFYLSSLGRITRQTITTEKGIEISEQSFIYDTHGNVLKTSHRYIDKQFVTVGESSQITHIYEYK